MPKPIALLYTYLQLEPTMVSYGLILIGQADFSTYVQTFPTVSIGQEIMPGKIGIISCSW
jgi:hypothetical protein